MATGYWLNLLRDLETTMTSRRIVSLVPSLTETVCQFGLIQNVVGCTSFCVDPPELMRLATNVGGTKTPDLAKIAQLVPTHILTNDEERRFLLSDH